MVWPEINDPIEESCHFFGWRNFASRSWPAFAHLLETELQTDSFFSAARAARNSWRSGAQELDAAHTSGRNSSETGPLGPWAEGISRTTGSDHIPMLIVSLGSLVPGDMLIAAASYSNLYSRVHEYRTSVWSTTSARKLWTLNSMLMRQLSTSHWSWQDSTSTMKMLLGTNWSLILETCPSHNLQSQLFLRVTSHKLTSYLTYILRFYLTIFIRHIFWFFSDNSHILILTFYLLFYWTYIWPFHLTFYQA